MTSVAAIIVNYRTADLALKAAESLLQQPSGAKLALHIVDNTSETGECAYLQRALSQRGWDRQVTVHCNRENVGFGQANNQVFRHLSDGTDVPEFVLLMNPDAYVETDALARLLSAMTTDPDAAFAGPALRLPGSGTLRQAAFRFPHLGTVFQRALQSPRLFALKPRWMIGLESGADTRRVDWVSGAFVLLRFKPVMALGGFDPDFFLYWEEVDLMRRAARKGWSCLHVPGAEAFHAEGAATRLASHQPGPPDYPAYYYESWRLYFTKAHGRIYTLMAACLWLLGSWICRFSTAMRGRPAPTIPVELTGRVVRHVILPLFRLSHR